MRTVRTYQLWPYLWECIIIGVAFASVKIFNWHNYAMYQLTNIHTTLWECLNATSSNPHSVTSTENNTIYFSRKWESMENRRRKHPSVCSRSHEVYTPPVYVVVMLCQLLHVLHFWSGQWLRTEERVSSTLSTLSRLGLSVCNGVLSTRPQTGVQFHLQVKKARQAMTVTSKPTVLSQNILR